VTNSRSMANSVVVVYFSRLGGRLRGHQKLMLDADARLIAKLMGCEFGGRHEATCNYSNSVFFVPVLLCEEAASLGIRSHSDLYGGVVPHPFVKTKAITHQLIGNGAQRPQCWSDIFAEKACEVALP